MRTARRSASIYSAIVCSRTPPSAGGSSVLILAGRNETDSYAAYADATYEVLPDLRLTVGGRETYEDKAFTFLQATTGVPVFPTVPQSTSRLSNDAFTPRFTADYRWTEALMTYVSVSRGWPHANPDHTRPGP